MTVLTTPVPARTDVAAAVPAADRDASVRRAGTLLAAGATAWAAALLSVGSNAGTVVGERVLDAGSLLFQAGALGLVTVMLQTAATGTTGGARLLLRVERVLLSLAMVWTVLHFADHRWADSTGWVLALDVFWPLSMLGMLVIGIKVLRARRWSGPLRWAPLIAESWLPFTLAGVALGAATGTDGVGDVVGGLHLLVGYARLGWLLRRSPELTRA